MRQEREVRESGLLKPLMVATPGFAIGGLLLGFDGMKVNAERIDRFLDYIVDLLFIEWQREIAASESAEVQEGTSSNGANEAGRDNEPE